MPYRPHFLDDTDDKPQELSEKDARTFISGKFRDARMRQLRWQQQRGRVDAKTACPDALKGP